MVDLVVGALLYLVSFEIVRFICVGVLCMAVHGAVYVLCNEKVGINYYASFAAGFAIALVVNFVLNKFWTFNNPDPEHIASEFVRFTIKKLVFLGIGEGILHYLVKMRGLHERLAGACAIVALGPFSYLVVKWIRGP